jgi:hypothetical protein
MSKQLFAINTSHGQLSLKAGYVRIAIGGYATIYEDDKDHPDFRDAFAKNWIKYSDTEPTKTVTPSINAIEFVNPVQGLSEDELKAELAKQKAEPETVNVTVEAIGKPAEAPVDVTEDSPSDAEPEASEGKKSRSKKAAQ